MTPQDEFSVRAYLLGTMASGDRDVIEERMIAEPDLAEQVEAMGGELIRDALKGALSLEDQARFDQYFLGNGGMRRKYSLTREMLIASGENARDLRPLPAQLVEKPRERGFDLWKLSFLAAAVALVFMTWQFIAVRASIRELATRAASSPGSVVSLLLAPDVRRGDSPTPTAPQAVQIAADARAILLRLQLEPSDNFETYTVTIANVDTGRQVWGQPGLKSTHDSAALTVTAEVPVSALPPGDYTVLLRTPERPNDPVVQGYSLRIPRN